MIDKILNEEALACYRFLMENTNFQEDSNGYGLTLDRNSNKNMATISGSGFMLSALVIGVVNKWDDFETNLSRARKTLINFYNNLPHYQGMFSHYLEYESGKRYKKCEYSTIDTAIFLNGMLTADNFFQDEIISEYAMIIFSRIDWEHFITELNGRKVFRMAYNDLIGGDYLKKSEQGWIHYWNIYAEQLMLYFLAAGSTLDQNTSKELFLGFERNVGGYKDNQFVFTPLGGLFVYQYSHAWFDFENYYDINVYDWFNNSSKAIMANYQYCQDNQENYKTFKAGFWGLSACDGPKGYRGYGAPIFVTYQGVTKKIGDKIDGTVALYSVFASLPLASNEVKKTVLLLKDYPEFSGKYGYYDSINLEKGLWVGRDYLSIDKGITLLMIDNYYRRTTWNYYTSHPLIIKAIEKLSFRKKDDIWQQ